jgi:hypothetical protein
MLRITNDKDRIWQQLQETVALCDATLSNHYDADVALLRTKLQRLVARHTEREASSLMDVVTPSRTKPTIFYPCAVQSQFNYKRGICKHACMPISMLLLYRFYRALYEGDGSMGDPIIMRVMDAAAILWEKWHNNLGGTSLLRPDYPHIMELLEMPDCRLFCDMFGKMPTRETGGLVQTIPERQNVDGDLTQTLHTLEEELLRDKRVAAIVLVVAGQNSVALFARQEQDARCSFLLFDSHGGLSMQQQQYCELAKFFTAESLVAHLIDKYNLAHSLTTLRLQAQKLSPQQELSHDLCSHCAYSASIFVLTPPLQEWQRQAHAETLKKKQRFY